jgi:hypothetical protein
MWTSGNGLLKRPLHKFFVTEREPVTNVKPIGNELVKSVTDQCPSVTGCLSLSLLVVVLVTGYKVHY